LSLEISILLSLALIITAIASLTSKSMSLSLIMLFYSSIILGIVFTIYEGEFAGLLHIITFAGAVSVMLLTTIVMIGEIKLDIGSKKTLLVLSSVITFIVLTSSYYMLLDFKPFKQELKNINLLEFLWEFRSWDLLILIMVLASSMIGIVNLLSKEVEQ